MLRHKRQNSLRKIKREQKMTSLFLLKRRLKYTLRIKIYKRIPISYSKDKCTKEILDTKVIKKIQPKLKIPKLNVLQKICTYK